MKAINIDKNILSGTPIFNGTRVPISILFDYLEDNKLDIFFENYPTVSKEQASKVIKLAGKLVNNPQNLDENFN
ncbi:MAG: DUF433 domain-containing protein [Acidobacteriota bacterium]